MAHVGNASRPLQCLSPGKKKLLVELLVQILDRLLLPTNLWFMGLWLFGEHDLLPSQTCPSGNFVLCFGVFARTS